MKLSDDGKLMNKKLLEKQKEGVSITGRKTHWELFVVEIGGTTAKQFCVT